MSVEKVVTPLPLSIHYCLRYISTGVIALSSAITLLCVFIIVYTSAKTSVTYVRLIVLVTLIPLSSDITYHFLFDPAPVFPLLCIFRWQPTIPIPGSVTIYYIIWTLTIAWNAIAYAACFFHRHQLVVPPGSFGKISRRTQFIFLGGLFAFSWLIAPILTLAQLPVDEASVLLNQTSGFTEAELIRTACFSIGGSYLTSHIFVLLRDSGRITMSEKTRNYHRIMTEALVTQAAVCFFFLLAPLVACYIVYIAQIDLPVLYILAFISTHSFAHSATVLLTTPLYRRALRELFSKGITKTVFVASREQSSNQHKR